MRKFTIAAVVVAASLAVSACGSEAPAPEATTEAAVEEASEAAVATDAAAATDAAGATEAATEAAM